jgi:predicted lipid-binding transport protein (Tim44 family)
MASSYGRARRQKAPKPLSVPVWSAVIGALFVVLGYGISSAFLAGFGMILLCWGIISSSILYVKRRRARQSLS